MGMLPRLRATGFDARQTDSLRNATESADPLLAMLKDILDMAQLESGRASLAAPVKLRALLRDVQSPMRPQATVKHLALHIRTRSSSRVAAPCFSPCGALAWVTARSNSSPPTTVSACTKRHRPTAGPALPGPPAADTRCSAPARSLRAVWHYRHRPAGRHTMIGSGSSRMPKRP